MSSPHLIAADYRRLADINRKAAQLVTRREDADALLVAAARLEAIAERMEAEGQQSEGPIRATSGEPSDLSIA